MKKEKTCEEKYRDRTRKYKRFLVCALVVGILNLAALWMLGMYTRIPGNIRLRVGEEQILDIHLPMRGEITKTGGIFGDAQEAVTADAQGTSNVVANSVRVDLSAPVTMKADTLNTYQMNLKLFGIIPFKQVNIEVIRDLKLTPVGQPVGIYLKTEGVLVVGIGDFLSLDGVSVAPARYLLREGDYILAVDGRDVDSKTVFTEMIENSDGSPVVLTVKRGDEVFSLRAQPVLNQGGKYKLGIWVRDNAQGVGTMTFVDEEGNFGALGHGINDVDTSMVMQLDSGTLYNTEIIAIKKGVRGEPGEMTGMIEYADRNILGVITENTARGIFGYCNRSMLDRIDGEPIPICLKQEVQLGPAQVLCTVDGEPKYYDISIEELHYDGSNINKCIVLKITDGELIGKTGGIVQGMSGAPIIQNGKFVGAITHVLVNDSTKGYGIFIEDMLMH